MPPVSATVHAMAEGHATLRFARAAAGRTVVHTARAHSPTRILLPNNRGDACWAFVASLGGGLVDGDAIALSVVVDAGARALLGTQASTKVYRSPRGSAQALTAHVGPGALLAVVPDPVSCFAGARYRQEVDVGLEDATSSLVLLDAFTCGRAARGERWAFDRYASRTRIARGGRLVAVDAVLLDPAHGDLASRMHAFDAFATIFAIGPGAAEVRSHVLVSAAAATGTALLLSATELGPDAVVARVAAPSAQALARTVRGLLAPLALTLGDDPFARRG